MPLDHDLRTTRRPLPRQLDLNGDWSLSSSRNKRTDTSLSTSIASMQSLGMAGGALPLSLQRTLPTSQTNLYDSSSTLSSVKSMSWRSEEGNESSHPSHDMRSTGHSGMSSCGTFNPTRPTEAECSLSWRPRSSFSTASSNQDDNDDSQQEFLTPFPRGYNARERSPSPRRQTPELTSHHAIRSDLFADDSKEDSTSSHQQLNRESKPTNQMDPFLTPQRKQRTEKELLDRRISPYRPMPRSAATELNPHLDCANADTTEASGSDDEASSKLRDSKRVEDFLSRTDNSSWSRRTFMSTASASVQDQASGDNNSRHRVLSLESGGSPHRAWSDSSSICPTSPVSSSARSPVSTAPSFVPAVASPRIACASKQSSQSMADRRETLYEFRKRMRKAFDRVENMVELHRDLFAKRDSIANEPIYDDVMAQQAESLASEVFADLKSLRDQFQGLTLQPQVRSTAIEQSDSATCKPKDAGFVATSSVPSSTHSSCRSQDEDDNDNSSQDQKDNDREDSVVSPSVSPSSTSKSLSVSFSHDDVSSSIDSRSYSSDNTHNTTNDDRENVFKDFDQRMEEIRASLKSITKGRSSQKQHGLGNQMEERRRNIRMRTEQQERSASQSQSDAHLLRLLQELSQADMHLSSPTRSS